MSANYPGCILSYYNKNAKGQCVRSDNKPDDICTCQIAISILFTIGKRKVWKTSTIVQQWKKERHTEYYN